MSPDLIAHLPQNWVGLFAVVAFTTYIGAQIVEKYEALAKIIPLGRWWHYRQKNRRGRRHEMVVEDNQIIQALQEQVTSIVAELAAVRETLRSFHAWSVYDARWHHAAQVDAASRDAYLSDHLDYFAFEAIWKDNPVEAAKMPTLGG